jgi:hypothetical protein
LLNGGCGNNRRNGDRRRRILPGVGVIVFEPIRIQRLRL